jgi:hypothetical protein
MMDISSHKNGLYELLALDKDEFEAPAVEFLISRLRPGFRIDRAGSIVDSMSGTPLGASRLGGLPDLPPDTPWPAAPDGRPLAFLAQLDLADTAGSGFEKPLPDDGSLYFFYDAEELPGGCGPEDCGHWCVLFSDAPATELIRPKQPEGLPDYSRFDARSIKLKPRLYLPSAETLEDELEQPPTARTPAEHFSQPAGDSVTNGAPNGEDPLRLLRAALADGRYGAWAAKLNGADEGAPDHRLLGHPQEVQSAMPSGFARLVADLPEREVPNPSNPESTFHLPAQRSAGWPEWARHVLGETPADEWHLLLQLDSDVWMWGDCGKLYFWIPREDLRALRFDRLWLEMQCS